MADKPRRKINPPSRLKKKIAEKRKFSEAQSSAASSTGTYAGAGRFFAVMITIVVLVAGLIWGVSYLNRMTEGERDPWNSWESRMTVDPASENEAKVYLYRPKEVQWWVAGARNPELEPAERQTLLTKSVDLLTVADATRVLEAAAQSRPDDPQVQALAGKLHDMANPADPVERDCRMRLAKLKGE